MGRPKQFSDDEVVAGVAAVFSVHGFNGTSVQMLADACSLGKQSLYNSFGDKQTLYLKALDCAAARFGAVAAEMTAAAHGRASIHLFFDFVLGQCGSADPSEQACIVSSGLLEGLQEPSIVEALRSKWERSHALLEAAVRRGQADGSITTEDAPDGLADLLMALMGGLRVSARAIDDPERLSHSINRALSLLDAPRKARPRKPR